MIVCVATWLGSAWGPAVGLAAWIVHPGLAREEIDQLTRIAGSTARAEWANGLGMLAIALGIFSVLALAHLVRESRSGAGYVGAGLAILGLVAVAISGGIGAAATELARTGFLTEDATILEGILAGPMGIVTLAGGVTLALGLLVLAIELFRARVVPEPSAVLLGVFGVAQVVGFALYSTPVVIAAFAAGLVALAPVGYRPHDGERLRVGARPADALLRASSSSDGTSRKEVRLTARATSS
jgi:hypothetical protein